MLAWAWLCDAMPEPFLRANYRPFSMPIRTAASVGGRCEETRSDPPRASSQVKQALYPGALQVCVPGVKGPGHSTRWTAYSRHAIGRPLFDSTSRYCLTSVSPAFVSTRADATFAALHQAVMRWAPSSWKPKV